MFKFVWKQDPGDVEIGYYTVHLEREDGSVVEGSEASLWDYTVPWQVTEHRSLDINDPETFRCSYCSFGVSSSKVYKASTNVTLEAVKKDVERFILQRFMQIYRSAVEREKEYRALAAWCTNQQMKEKSHETEFQFSQPND